MRSTEDRRRGFTIVEILVIIGIIAVLAGLILPALGGASRRASKAKEVNNIRQVGVAWNLYSNSNRDSALPGFLEDGNGSQVANVQGNLGWKVRYKLPASLIPNEPSFVPADESEEWPWRLLSYLDYDHDTILGYLNKDDTTPFKMSDYTVDPLDPDSSLPRPIEIAEQPAFGYNAFYVGGWWEMTQIGPAELIAVHRFKDAMTIPQSDGGDQSRIQVVSKSPSTIRNSARVITFCSSSIIDPGDHFRTLDRRPGAHYVVPPFYAETAMWGRSQTTPSETVIQIQSGTPLPVAAPIGRYTEQAAVLHADLHTAPETPGALVDQRRWIDMADNRDFKHTESN